MHGNSPEFLLLVNAEVDSMGGVIDGGVGTDNKISPRRAAIEKAQAELRQEYDVRQERRRELEFLEKGGNPLDFKLGHATSISVQSTSVADQFVNSEAKDSFALTASPRGDSVESSGRPGAALTRETNTADNLLFFDGENDVVLGKQTSTHHGRSNVPPSELVSQLDVCNNVKEAEDSGMLRFVVKSQAAYARRNRSKTSRENARLCSTDLVSAGNRNGSSVSRSRHGTRDAKGILCEATMLKDRTVKSNCNAKSTKPNGNVVCKTVVADNQLDKESDAREAYGTASGPARVGDAESDVRAFKKLRGMEHNQLPQVDANKGPKLAISMTPDSTVEKERVSSAPKCIPSAASINVENVTSASQRNSFSTSKIDGVDMLKGGNSLATINRKGGVNPESSCVQIGLCVDEKTPSDCPLISKAIISPGNSDKEMTFGVTSTDLETINFVKEKKETKVVEVPGDGNVDYTDFPLMSNSGSCIKVEVEKNDSIPHMKNELKSLSNHERTEHKIHRGSHTEVKSCDLNGEESNTKRMGLCPQGRPLINPGSTNCDPMKVNLSSGCLIEAPELQICVENKMKLAKKVHEESILEEARSIEAKRKRIAELSVRSYPLLYRRKSHWDFVLEEMVWLANDFMQERLWKTTAAAQVSHKAASSAHLRIKKQNLCCEQKHIAHTLTKAVMQFWCSAEELRKTDSSSGHENIKLDLVGSETVAEKKTKDYRSGDTDMEGMSRHLEGQETVKSHSHAIQEYAVRFLKYSISLNCPIQPRSPKTPERLSDAGIAEMFSEDQFSEEALFYTVPPGAMEEYRKSVENDCSKYEKIDSSVLGEEVETSIYGAVEEFGTQENVYEEDEAGTYCLPGGYEGSKSSKSAQKRKKALQKSYARSLDVGAGLSYGQFTENRKGTNHSLFLGKRPNNVNVGSIPIKRVRTASRRLTCAGAVGSVQMPGKADASSGDTCSYQDDLSTIHGGSHNRKTMEAESTGEYGKQLPFDYTEVSMKPKKRKKPKNMMHKNSMENGAYVVGKGPAYEQRWQLDSMVQNEQRDYSKKRSESHAFESNGNSGVFGQHATKRPKILKQSLDTSESNTPMTGSVPSPVASQMSNMSSPNKFMKMIAGRERGRKNKALKVPAGQSGSGSPWSLFEDQALVVLVHDMGPNWELVSDAISSTLQFKCIFRNPKECKERHKILMDGNSGDGADSAEDSGSSQPYPSTLPGIPKGSARQLFQRLQGPMEEDTLKSHFEKIILIGQKQHSRRSQSDNQALKQMTPVHNSHAVALSQVSPNNLNGAILTPLDLCDASISSCSDVTLGPQGSHTSGLAISNQGPTQPVLPTVSANSMLQGSVPMVLDNSLPSPSATLNTSSRDGQRYGVPRSPSLPNNENQKMQQYTQMFPGKNSQHCNVSPPGSLPTDRGVRALTGGNGMGVMSGLSRGMTMPRPGYQGIGSPTMLNMVSSGSILSTSGVGMPNTANMPNGVVSGQGSSVMRPREGLHMMRVPEEQRQMTMQELQMHVTQGNSQPSFNTLSTGYSNQSVSTPVQTFPVQHHQQHPMAQQQPHVLTNPHHPHLPGNNHTTTSQQQAYMVRIAKERQLHQRIIHQHNQQQPHQFASSNAVVPHVQPQQHPLSSSPNNSHIQQQASSQSLPTASANTHHPLTSPMNAVSTQSQQKHHHLPQHGLGKNPQTSGGNLPNQLLKQRHRQQQQHQHPGRHHPQQRQQSQSHQQAKLTKGMGRGNMMHQSISIDTSHVNGHSGALGHNVSEKSEQAMLAMQGQGLPSGPGSNPIQPGKSLVAPQHINQGSLQQNLFSRSPPSSSKQLLQMPSHADNSNKGQQVPSVSSGHALVASQQPVLPLAMSSQQQQPQHRGPSQSQPTVHRIPQQNCPVNSDSSLQSPVDQNQVDQEPPTNTFHMATLPSIPAPSASAPTHWKAQEPLSGLSTPNAASHMAGNSSLPSSLGSEPVTLPNQGPIQRQSSGGMPIHTYGVQPQWQPHMQQQKQLLPPPQQPSPPQHQQPLSQQPQMQQQPQQNLQSVQGCLYTAPSNSGPA